MNNLEDRHINLRIWKWKIKKLGKLWEKNKD